MKQFLVFGQPTAKYPASFQCRVRGKAMTEREEFEKWFKKDFHYEKSGPYVKNMLLEAWQAAKAQAVSQWIPVSEQMPENEGTYFCLGHNGTPFVCLLRNKKYEGYVWLRNTGARLVDGITHWMPIPSLQEQNK